MILYFFNIRTECAEKFDGIFYSVLTILFSDDGEGVLLRNKHHSLPARLVLVAGKPIGNPVDSVRGQSYVRCLPKY